MRSWNGRFFPHLDGQHAPAELVVQQAQRLVDQPEAEQHAVDHAVKGHGVQDEEGRHQRRHEQRDLDDRSDEPGAGRRRRRNSASG